MTDSKSSAAQVVTISREEMRSRAHAFAKEWAGHQREESDAKTFVDQFFDVFGRDRRAADAKFEHHVERENRGDGRIDLLWPGKLVIEMKSTGRDLSDQKGGAAYQAFEYIGGLEAEDRPRWVLVSDFAHFVLYDLGEEVNELLKGLSLARKTKPTLAAQFTLQQLPDKLHHFAFIRDEEQQLFTTEPEVNMKAVALLGQLHDELKTSGYKGHQLERFLVRILFCVFAEDTAIFEWNSFTRFVQKKGTGTDIGQRLAKLFQILNQDYDQRPQNLDKEFAGFPYVNGGLFAERLDIAELTTQQRAALLQCCQFDWTRISPGVFGSLFQGVMEPKERRSKGAHYTSEDNILKLIKPLFLDDLRNEFIKLGAIAGKKKALDQFHLKLASLKFLDPACGCGNFLVVAYRELRAIELEVLQAQYGNQLPLGLNVGDLARVNIDQFYGIELEEFPSLIAETAMWLTDHQVNMSFSKAFGKNYARIPLKKSAAIHNKNALRTDWRTVLPAEQCSYILGNPPFIGKQVMTADQSADMTLICANIKGYGVLDYVTAWYVEAAAYIQGTSIRCAFVSTNSISQGEQVGLLWAHLFRRGIKIHFAHRTFVWTNEASGKAHVHVIIIGFGIGNVPTKRLYETDDNGKPIVSTGMANLNAYLIAGPDMAVHKRRAPLDDCQPMLYGSKPVDGGFLILSPKEKAELLEDSPQAAAFIRPFRGSQELINGQDRYCIWLADENPSVWRKIPAILSRVESVRAFREVSPKPQTVEQAKTPFIFGELRQPASAYLAIPEVSSEARNYIPIGFLDADVIASNLLYTVANASPYTFGILTSGMHMAWTRTICGRLKSDYRYSAGLVYNNYPWPKPTTKQRAAIQATAQAVLDARKPHLAAGSNLADLYDPLTMPAALLKAHQALDRAVENAYRSKPFANDRERVEYLFALYEKLTAPLAPVAKASQRKRPQPA